MNWFSFLFGYCVVEVLLRVMCFFDGVLIFNIKCVNVFLFDLDGFMMISIELGEIVLERLWKRNWFWLGWMMVIFLNLSLFLGLGIVNWVWLLFGNLRSVLIFFYFECVWIIDCYVVSDFLIGVIVWVRRMDVVIIFLVVVVLVIVRVVFVFNMVICRVKWK